VKGLRRIEIARTAVTVGTELCITAKPQHHRARCYEDLQHSAQTYVNRRQRDNNNESGGWKLQGLYTLLEFSSTKSSIPTVRI
jgi:hypothetical protein